MSTVSLEFREVGVLYGPIQALRRASPQINRGEAVNLIGVNSAGESMLLMSIFGQPRATAEQILYHDQDIRQRPAYYVASNGIAQSPGGRRVFPDMDTEENLLMGITPIGMDHAEEDMRHVSELFPRLKEWRNQRAMTISGDEQQMLAIARTLMSRLKPLLLDEPSPGLTPIMVKQIFQTLRRLARSGMTIFLVEQNANHAPKLSDRTYVMATGEIRMSGSGEKPLGNQEIYNAYPGGH